MSGGGEEEKGCCYWTRKFGVCTPEYNSSRTRPELKSETVVLHYTGGRKEEEQERRGGFAKKKEKNK